MDIFTLFPLELKLIVISKLPPGLIRDLKLNGKYSEIVHSYRSPGSYQRIKEIIKLNQKYDFDDYNEDSSCIWKIVLRDDLLYHERYPGDYNFVQNLDNFRSIQGEVHDITLSFLALISLSKLDDIDYASLREFVKIPLGPYLLVEAMMIHGAYKDATELDDLNPNDIVLNTPLILVVVYKDKLPNLSKKLYKQIKNFYENVINGIETDDDFDADEVLPVSTYYTYRVLYDYAYNKMTEYVSTGYIKLI